MSLGAGPVKADLLSADDANTYHQAFESALARHYDWAAADAAQAHDRLLAKAVQWFTYTNPDSGARFEEITAFIGANPGWPQSATLERRAEEAIDGTTPEPAILAWFAANVPQTVDGAMAYGRALIDAGQQDRAEKLLRETWITGNFKAVQEKQFLDGFQGVLRDSDDQARLDRLLWDHQAQAAAQQMTRVSGAYRQFAQARLALESDAPDAEAQAAALPDPLKNDPGLIYALIRYFRQNDKDDQAIALLSHPGVGRIRPELWWSERAILARRALAQGHAADAYDVARRHGLKDGAGFAEAEWLSGWIALRFLGNGEAALAHFARMYDRVSTVQSKARAAYWAGRAAQAQGQNDEAARWYALAAGQLTTFYGQLASERLAQPWTLPADPQASPEETEQFERLELVRVARMLAEVKEPELIRPFLLQACEQSAGTPGARAAAAGLAITLGRPDVAVFIARRSERDGTPMIGAGYPMPDLAAPATVERALVLGLIRQESAFHDQAISPVGARGLMQLMPATASRIAKAMNMGFKQQDALADALTQDPGLNVKLGSAYLSDLLGQFNGSYVLAVASYNAGPNRVKKWLHDMGDPRGAGVDAVDWIEGIPFSETRNYVQRVLEGTQVYRHRLGAGDSTMTLEKDIKR